MKTCSKCGEEKELSGFSLKNGKPDARCKVCKAVAAATWRKSNPERNRQMQRDWYALNGDRVQARNAEWRAANPERAKVNNANAMARWQKKHPDRAAHHSAKRRAAKHQATPAWANSAKIKEFYFAADFLGMVTGEWYHVDHVVPLKGKTVCGLHNEFNLQVLLGAENMRKGNRTWPGKP